MVSGFNDTGITLINYVGDDTRVVIPQSCLINGTSYNVTELKETFRGCAEITNVTIPETVTHIFGGTFLNCGGLEADVNENASITFLGMQPPLLTRDEIDGTGGSKAFHCYLFFYETYKPDGSRKDQIRSTNGCPIYVLQVL